MKKFYSIIVAVLILVTIPVFAFAASNEIDLSGMSYDELVELKDRINLAIWESEEWQEVEVPQGVWEVGADIPEGKWTIIPTEGMVVSVSVGTEVTNGGTHVKAKAYSQLRSPTDKRFDANKDISEWSVELKKGDFVQIQLGTAVFTPYSGKPSLGFKTNG